MDDNTISRFWACFDIQDFDGAQRYFDSLSDTDKQVIFRDLFQQSKHCQKPLALSVLRRELYQQKRLSDFYQAWLPTRNSCQPIQLGQQMFQQHFTLPTRVINAVNIANAKEVLSVSLVWAQDEQQENKFWQYFDKLKTGEAQDNTQRHASIEQAAKGELLGIYKTEYDDNLGTPF